MILLGLVVFAALEFFERTEGEQAERGPTTYRAAISACEKNFNSPASELFGRMEGEQVGRGTITYSAAISACEKNIQWPAL